MAAAALVAIPLALRYNLVLVRFISGVTLGAVKF
jgi:ABC-type maltose transport system permease subunit